MAPDNLLVELFLIALSILAASAAILIPWYSGNSPKPILGGILLIPAGILGYQEIQIVQLEQTLSKAIQTYSATNDLTVSCDRFSQHFIQTNQRAGEVWFNSDGTPENDTRLMYRTCNTLLPLEPQLSAALANSDVPSFPISSEQAYMLHVLSHELQHLLGIRDEATAECYAHQNNPAFFTLLRIEDPIDTAHRTHAENYPNLPFSYKSGECKPGGSLDLNLQPSLW